MTTATQFVHANGLRLAYHEWPGKPGAPRVVCLPHLTGHKGSFVHLAAALAPDFHVYAFDLRGRGDSDHPAEGYGFAGHARDIEAAADVLGLGAFAVVGHSFGATAAVYLASTRQARVTALALLDGGADPRDDTLKAMFATVRRLGQVYPSFEAYRSAQQALPFHQPWSPALEQYFQEEVIVGPDGAVTSKSSAAAIEHDLTLHFDYSMCEHFPHLSCPVLFLRPQQGLRGDRGHVFSEAEAANIVRHIPNCRRVDVPGVNHYTLLINDASPAAGEIKGFLKQALL